MILLNANGVNLKNPNGLQFEYYNLTKSGRLASGKMTMEIIAQKHKFCCTYASISSADFNTMMGAVFNPAVPFYTLKAFKDNVWTECIVYTGDIAKTLVRTGSIWYYKDLKIDFIEQ